MPTLARCAVLAAMLFSSSSCDSTGEKASEQVEAQSHLEIGDFQIPVFTTPEEQFGYTRSWFAAKEMKHATLKAFLHLYPEEREKSGLIALDLAYLKLGSDYRFAPENLVVAALSSYRAIVEEFGDYSAIAAKALWYTGWIYTNLLHDRKNGFAAYRRVISEYPREPISRLPTPPWLSLTFAQEKAQSNSSTTTRDSHWAALALLEIIKHAEDAESGWQAFRKLWQEYPDDIATGIGLRVVLTRGYHLDELLAIAEQFLERGVSNIHLFNDIRREVDLLNLTGEEL